MVGLIASLYESMLFSGELTDATCPTIYSSLVYETRVKVYVPEPGKKKKNPAMWKTENFCRLDQTLLLIVMPNKRLNVGLISTVYTGKYPKDPSS